MSRLCVHPEYQGNDVLQGMLEHGLLPNYQRIGFKRLNASYKPPHLNNREHHLILASRKDFLNGQRINILVWNTMFGELIRYLTDRELVPISGFELRTIRVKLWFQPLAKWLLENRAKRAFQKHLEVLRQTPFLHP